MSVYEYVLTQHSRSDHATLRKEGPKHGDNATWVRLNLLWQYLTSSAVAPLTKAFVETEEPACSRVGPADDVFSEGYHQVWFSNAEVTKDTIE